MQKKKFLLLFCLIIFQFFFVNLKHPRAFSSDNYQYRNLCNTFEVAAFKKDGSITTVSCHGTYEEAREKMKQEKANDLAIMAKVAGKTKIIDANSALLDLSVNPETLTYFYTNSELTGSAYTYMDTGSLYGGVDGAHIDSAYSSYKNIWTAKVRIGDFTGWIPQQSYEIVPITWVNSSSSYTITDNSIRHNYVAKIQNQYYGKAGSTIGPKPEMLSPGTYYSYDGHYFYKNLETLIKDYKNETYYNSVNRDNAYYNYYMYLSNHTKTNYSSINIDEYLRNNLGIKKDAFGNSSINGSSRLYGKGTFFYYAQEKYGVNAILSLSLSRNETGNGRSNLAINKNNGFGLNAVDSNPSESANWYASFASSILGYASKWITYGYADPNDWRYYGPQFGNKWIGMNVKYASDTYWSEKMAANYYSLDNAFGLQDYNTYQLGVVTSNIKAYRDSNTYQKEIYSYKHAEDALVIVGEKKGQTINGNNTWYKIVSDINLDSNYNEITSGNYNWDSYVYVPAAYVKKINKAKNGYISPNDITPYQNKDYTYDLMVEDTKFKPLVAKSLKDTKYHFDSSLLSPTGQNLLKDRYVMVHAIAYKNNQPVSYLVTSDYWYDQKEWVNANDIKLVKSNYGKVSVTVSGNQYTWVNYTTEDTKSTLISGLYTNSYVPVLEEKTVSGYKWYKVPVSLSNNSNVYGWTLASAPGVSIKLSTSTVENNLPQIEAVDKTIVQGTEFKAKEGVTATDFEDGNLTDKIEIIKNDVKKDVVGTYEVVYRVTDSSNGSTTKTIKVTVTKNKYPEIKAQDIEILQGKELNELKDVTATDEEDGDLTKKVKVAESTVKKDIPGTYKIVYEVIDSYNQKTTKEIKVTIIKDEAPVINAKDLVLTQKENFDELKDVTATDKEDGDLTKKIEVIENTVNTKKEGEYIVTYKVIDSYKNTTTKTIKVKVVKNQLPVINATDKEIYLNEEFNELKDVTATDKEDGDLTKKIEVIENTINIKEVGEYIVIYQVEDSFGNKVTKKIKVTVKEKKLEEQPGEFYLDNLKWNSKENKYTISGYLIVLNQDNNQEEIKYELILKNIDNKEEFKLNVSPWTKDVPYELGEENGHDYSNSWFKGNIDLSKIPNGDYDLYMKTTKGKYYTEKIVGNPFNKELDKRIENNNKGYDFKVLLSLKSQQIQLSIRDELITTSKANTYRNMINDYDDISFKNNKLVVKGTSYNYDGTYSDQNKITRKLIFENMNNYKQYTYNIGSTNKGSYNVISNDKKSKEFAWYDKEIDISELPKGKYSLLVYTKTVDSEDFGEIKDMFGTVNEKEATINGKKYKVILNKARHNRIELIVE